MSDELVRRGWVTGNAYDDSADTRGWLVGHFISPSHGIRTTRHVEVKWAHHLAGEKRPEWTSGDQHTTLVILVSGQLRVDVTGGSSNLRGQGEYIMWEPGIDHSWEALADSVVVTVRWPSAS